MQYLGHTYAKKLFVVYLKFRFNWDLLFNTAALLQWALVAPPFQGGGI